MVHVRSQWRQRQKVVFTVMTFARVSTALPLQNGHMVGRVTTSSNLIRTCRCLRVWNATPPHEHRGLTEHRPQPPQPRRHPACCPAAYWLHLDPCVCSRVNSPRPFRRGRPYLLRGVSVANTLPGYGLVCAGCSIEHTRAGQLGRKIAVDFPELSPPAFEECSLPVDGCAPTGPLWPPIGARVKTPRNFSSTVSRDRP